MYGAFPRETRLLTAVALAASLTACGKTESDPAPLWKLEATGTDATGTTARRQYPLKNGDWFGVVANCDDTDLTFTFEYHQAGQAVIPFLAMENGSVRVIYRQDDRAPDIIASKSDNLSEARVVFSSSVMDTIQEGNKLNAEATGEEADRARNAAIYESLSPRYLHGFLRARNAKFSFPIGPNGIEIVDIAPQDGDFQKVVHACKFDQ